MGPKSKGSIDRMRVTHEDGQEYHQKRERNNVAVKKSREKSRVKQRETLENVDRLRVENQELEMKVTLLSKELQVLRDLFLEHAGANLPPGCEDQVDIKVEAGPPVNKVAAKMDHEYSTRPFRS